MHCSTSSGKAGVVCGERRFRATLEAAARKKFDLVGETKQAPGLASIVFSACMLSTKPQNLDE
jgi:hypothetical protein